MTHVLPLCRHCNRNRANRPRGLCWSCYYTPGVKDCYPLNGKYTTRGFGLTTGAGATPEPTHCAPGTPEKMAVLKERAKLGQRLWHPQDNRGG